MCRCATWRHVEHMLTLTLSLVCVRCALCSCSETLKSIFDNAVSPDLIKISIFDQIYAKDGEKQCVDVFCELVGESACRRKQIVSSQIDAANAKVRLAVHVLESLCS